MVSFMKSELEKLNDCEEYCFLDEEVANVKINATVLCDKLNSISQKNPTGRLAIIKELFGKIGDNPDIQHNFSCDCGKNIFAGDNLLLNYIGF